MSALPVVAVHRLPSEVDARVRRACLRAGARVVGSDDLQEGSAALLVVHLPRRARRIPPDALDVAGRVDARLPILLACDEALVHPTTTLSFGGITLVEHAATERLYSQIRIALAAARSPSAPGPLGDSMEAAGPHWWLSVVRGDAPVVAARNDELTSRILAFTWCATSRATLTSLARDPTRPARPPAALPPLPSPSPPSPPRPRHPRLRRPHPPLQG